jgi:hypothetical protein
MRELRINGRWKRSSKRRDPPGHLFYIDPAPTVIYTEAFVGDDGTPFAQRSGELIFG